MIAFITPLILYLSFFGIISLLFLHLRRTPHSLLAFFIPILIPAILEFLNDIIDINGCCHSDGFHNLVKKI